MRIVTIFMQDTQSGETLKPASFNKEDDGFELAKRRMLEMLKLHIHPSSLPEDDDIDDLSIEELVDIGNEEHSSTGIRYGAIFSEVEWW